MYVLGCLLLADRQYYFVIVYKMSDNEHESQQCVHSSLTPILWLNCYIHRVSQKVPHTVYKLSAYLS